jgi:hypothetical protein
MATLGKLQILAHYINIAHGKSTYPLLATLHANCHTSIMQNSCSVSVMLNIDSRLPWQHCPLLHGIGDSVDSNNAKCRHLVAHLWQRSVCIVAQIGKRKNLQKYLHTHDNTQIVSGSIYIYVHVLYSTSWLLVKEIALHRSKNFFVSPIWFYMSAKWIESFFPVNFVWLSNGCWLFDQRVVHCCSLASVVSACWVDCTVTVCPVDYIVLRLSSELLCVCLLN